jgi:two-component system CheB/CheR fusion protein
MLIFSEQNIIKDPPFSKLDLITCRNLLIYLGPVLQGKVMRLFHYALKRDGFLVLGNSEHIGSTGEKFFEPLDKQHRIYSRKDVPATVTTEFTGYEEFPDRARPHHPAVTAQENQVKVDRMILARYSPPAVVVNKALKITSSEAIPHHTWSIRPVRPAWSLPDWRALDLVPRFATWWKKRIRQRVR